MRVQFERFYTYAELTETLEAWAKDNPQLFSVESIGNSYEGRDIWLCTVTNTETGAASEKPAVFVHAQIHSMEFTGTTAALNLLDHLRRPDRAAYLEAIAHDARIGEQSGHIVFAKRRHTFDLEAVERAAIGLAFAQHREPA